MKNEKRQQRKRKTSTTNGEERKLTLIIGLCEKQQKQRNKKFLPSNKLLETHIFIV
jgi:hypothetical protein